MGRGTVSRTAVSVTVLWLFSGCSLEESGEPVDLSTHCGVFEFEFQGQWFQRDEGKLDDGSGNAPPGWEVPYQSGMLDVDGTTATFTDDDGHEEEFTAVSGPSESCD